MDILILIAVIALIYIIQIPLILSFPYYEYRKNHKEKTIGDFMDFTNKEYGEVYIFLTFFPLVGLIMFILGSIVSFITIGLAKVYCKYIKNIKI